MKNFLLSVVFLFVSGTAFGQVISPAVIPQPIVGEPYSVQLTSSVPCTWLKEGNVPPGLGLTHGGLIVGTPTTVGKYKLTVGCDTDYSPVYGYITPPTIISYYLTINPPPFVSVTWTASLTTGATYNVYRGSAPGLESATPLSTGIYSDGFVDEAVRRGQTVCYTVEAVGTDGSVSAMSNEACTKVPLDNDWASWYPIGE